MNRKCVAVVALLLSGVGGVLRAQQAGAPRRVHLVMRDGSYQLVLSYSVDGDVVRFRSAERNGEMEEAPLALVDLEATREWVAEHDQNVNGDSQKRSVLSPQMAREEALRTASRPEVSPGLRLPEEDSVVALDEFEGVPELVPLEQVGGDLNKETAHNVLPQAVPPAAVAHRVLDMAGGQAEVQLHTSRPVFYVRVGDAEPGDDGGAFVVDTHGASGRATPSGGGRKSRYVVEQVDARNDARVVNSVRIRQLGVKAQPGVTELVADTLPGGIWVRLTPAQPLLAGEYVLMEVLSDHELNLGVWDFGVHADAKEDVEAVRPQSGHESTLERRVPQASR